VTEPRSYYGQAVLKEPVWSWEIPIYFFTGGVAGASAGFAYLCDLRGDEVLARRAWAAALAGVSVSPLLLISDLGKPIRFLNMFRMFKITSPMSVGSWILGVSGATTTAAAAHAWLELFPGLAKLARPTAALFGLPLSTYTAALVANTSVPVWRDARQLLPFVFGSGAALTAGAACAVITPPEYAAPARRLAVAATVAELGFKEVMEKRLGETGAPYRKGAAAAFSHAGRACLTVGAGLLATRGSRSRAAAAAAGTLLLAGALCVRWSVFKAGSASAADPRYVVGPQRGRIDRGESSGAARREPSLGGDRGEHVEVGGPAGGPAGGDAAQDRGDD
jgi:formate-dependent nitrite reductase membrane component NrfD